MGLADWVDDESLAKVMKKGTSKSEIKKEIIDWIIENTIGGIKEKIEIDATTPVPMIVNYDGSIIFNGEAKSITNDLFEWGEVNKIFCCNCGELKLENVPEDKLITECSHCNVSTFYYFENSLNTEISDKYNCATPEFVKKVQEIHKQKVIPSLLNIKDEILSWKSVPLSIGCIPIHFDENKNRRKYEEINDAENYLGLYRINSKNNKREIILFEDAIKSEAKGNDEYLDNLIWKVIVHEYAHAIMDDVFHNENKLRKQDPKLYKYREESLANAFALKVLEKSLGNVWINGGCSALTTRWGFDKIKEFVRNQPEEYRHGLDLYQRDDLFKMMEFWRETKIVGNKSF